MPHEREEIRAGEPARAASHHGDVPRGVHAVRRGCHLVGGSLVHGEPLDAADVHRRVDEGAAAPGLAGVLAHERAGRGERVVLAHQVHGTGVVAGRHEADVAGHVHVRRAERLAGHRLAHARGAGARAHVARVLVGELLQALEQGVRRLVADGAVRRVAHHLGQRAGLGEHPRVRLAVRHAPDERGQPRQAVAARHALSARLRRSRLQKRPLHHDRAGARRRGRHTAHISV